VPASDSSRARQVWLWAPVLIYMLAIFYVSALPSPPLPERVSDKTGHVAAYVGLAVLAVRAAGGGLPRRVRMRGALLALGVTLGYAAFDEIHQMFVPGRFGDLADWYADCVGAFIGLGACWAWGMMAVRWRESST
jgi:VanZ family protein